MQNTPTVTSSTKSKKIIIITFAVIISGILVGALLKSKQSGEVQGALTESSPIVTPQLSTPIPIPTSTKTPSPTDSPLPVQTLDPQSEGANEVTDSPTPTPTPSPTPTSTPSPDTYNASITSVSNQAVADGVNKVNVTVYMTKNGNADCGETISLTSNSPAINITTPDPSTCSSGNTIFTLTSTQAGTFTITPLVYNSPYTSSNIVFTSP